MESVRRETATEDNWMYPPAEGWTIDQVSGLELPFDWELVDGVIVARGQTKVWHNQVRDALADVLKDARTEPYAVLTEQCVEYDAQNAPRPDVIVYDPTGLNVFELECIPVAKVVLVVEAVSPGSRQHDRVRKPALFAAAKVPYYWRVELDRDGELGIHEYWLHHQLREYIPAVDHPVHRKRLDTGVPFPVACDVSALLEL